jgi:hypothetical protein
MAFLLRQRNVGHCRSHSKVPQCGTLFPWIVSVLIAAFRCFTSRHKLACESYGTPHLDRPLIAACSSVSGALVQRTPPFVPTNSIRPPGKSSPLTVRFSTA